MQPNDAYGGMMRLVPPLDSISRLFKHPPIDESMPFQVIARGTPSRHASREQLEDTSSRALETLVEHAAGVALGPVAGVNFDANCVEIEFTVEAVSVEELHRKIGQVMRTLEEGGRFEYHDSSASRLDADREAVLT
jgi:hypothetical protein